MHRSDHSFASLIDMHDLLREVEAVSIPLPANSLLPGQFLVDPFNASLVKLGHLGRVLIKPQIGGPLSGQTDEHLLISRLTG
jgi:hypothetical protein